MKVRKEFVCDGCGGIDVIDDEYIGKQRQAALSQILCKHPIMA